MPRKNKRSRKVDFIYYRPTPTTIRKIGVATDLPDITHIKKASNKQLRRMQLDIRVAREGIMDYYRGALKKLNWVEITEWWCEGIFNHIENGHNTFTDKPPAITIDQEMAWRNRKWSKLHTYLNTITKDVL